VVRAGANGIAHQVREPPGPDDELLELLKRHDVFACTSMGIEKGFSSDPAWMDDPALAETVPADVIEAWKAQVTGLAPEMTDRMRAQYAVIEHSLRRYVETGVKAILSADTGLLSQAPGFAEHRELEAMVDAGMPVLDAIRAGTEVPAEVLRLPDRGTLQPGKRADFIVLEADPLDDIRNTRRIAAVHFRGRAIDRERLAAAWGTRAPA
jgi:imidazolonepropionase-like amidohydrolase